ACNPHTSRCLAKERAMCQSPPYQVGLGESDQAYPRESPAAPREMCISGQKFHAACSSERDIERIGRRHAVREDMSLKQERREGYALRGEPRETHDGRIEPTAGQHAVPEEPPESPIDLDVEVRRDDEAFVRDRGCGYDA